jgi:hypothetical protein
LASWSVRRQTRLGPSCSRAPQRAVEVHDAIHVLAVTAQPLGDEVSADLALGGPERRAGQLALVELFLVQEPSANRSR